MSSGGLGWPDNGRRIILDGDIAACACNPKPRVIANRQYSSSIEIEEKVQATLVFDEQFILKDSSEIPMGNIYYTIKMHTGKYLHGVTDENGKTERIATDGIELLEVYVGHLEEF